jgi:hypothetical protein
VPYYGGGYIYYPPRVETQTIVVQEAQSVTPPPTTVEIPEGSVIVQNGVAIANVDGKIIIYQAESKDK